MQHWQQLLSVHVQMYSKYLYEYILWTLLQHNMAKYHMLSLIFVVEMSVFIWYASCYSDNVHGKMHWFSSYQISIIMSGALYTTVASLDWRHFAVWDQISKRQKRISQAQTNHWARVCFFSFFCCDNFPNSSIFKWKVWVYHPGVHLTCQLKQQAAV